MARHRIMVVDDDSDVRFVVTSLLGLEFETVEALNGLDALEKIDRYEPDLLLLDISMPIMNGISCCQAIQRNSEFSHLPVFYLTALSDKKTREAAIAAGAKGYFEKPFESAQLIASLKNYLKESGLEPREKSFSLDEVRKIDDMPLRAAGDETEGDHELAADKPASGIAVELDEPTRPLPTPEGKKRRVFGKKRERKEQETVSEPEVSEPEPEPEAKPEAPSADDTVNLPPPPKPDYGRIKERYEKQKQAPPPPPKKREPERRSWPISSDEVEKPPAPPPDEPTAPLPALRDWSPEPEQVSEPAPPPTPEPPKPAMPTQPQKPAPPPAKESGPSPADILAQRRLAIIGRSRAPQSLKPRVLVIIDQQKQLGICHGGLKGWAEFLPLEDPVEAIELIARFQPDIVMMGILEEKYSGLQLAGMLRSNNRLSHIEVLFIQGAWVEEKHLGAARNLTRNPILKPPLTELNVKHAVEAITRKPGFKVREKKLSYGIYVKEVIRAAEAERARENKEKERESLAAHVHSLAKFMADELQDYREPAGYEELKGIGRKVHRVQD